MNVHVVRQGDCFFSIAKLYGFSWVKLYEHPDNAELRQKRPNPFVLFPGDRVAIPNNETKNILGQTEKQHRFCISAKQPLIRLKLQDDLDYPLSGVYYKLTSGIQVVEGKTDSSGMVEVEIKPRTQDVKLEVWPGGRQSEASLTWPIKIGYLDPIEFVTGIQARLFNLGFECGPVDGTVGPLTKKAVQAFQHEFGLKEDGIPGPLTQAQLEQAHGC